MEGRAHAKSDARHLEQVTPHMIGEDRVTVADDGGWEPVEANDALKEGPIDGRGGVRMAEGNEVRILGEAVDDGEDD
jgi:hypothetical protein